MDKEKMTSRVLHIKNMVCPRCIKVVRDELENLGLTIIEIELGRAVIEEDAIVDDETIAAVLGLTGLELLRDKRQELVERIKLAVINLIYNEKLSVLKTNISTYLAEELEMDYATLSTAFKTSEAIALNRYIVLQKVERAKELLAYDELTLNNITSKLGYKSLQHLSSQFKEVTGVSPNAYRKHGGADRHSIDDLH